MGQLVVHTGDFTFQARFEEKLAPITLTSNLDRLPELGKTVLWKAEQKVRFEAM